MYSAAGDEAEGSLDLKKLSLQLRRPHVHDLRNFERHRVNRHHPGRVNINELFEADPLNLMGRDEPCTDKTAVCSLSEH